MFAHNQTGMFPLPPATGGIITYANIGGINYTFHTFTSNSYFTLTTNQIANSSISYVVVGAGGTGGYTQNQNYTPPGGSYNVLHQCGGGGGGGQVIQSSGTVGAKGSTYQVTVGAGVEWPTNGAAGGNSAFFGQTTVGGGAGALNLGFSGQPLTGYAGSSGGGAGSGNIGTPGAAGGSATTAGGHAGGNGGSLQSYGAGGGGSDTTAGNGSTGGINPGGASAGAAGVAVTISGNTVYYGAGGGGGGIGASLGGVEIGGVDGGPGGSGVGGTGSGWYANGVPAYGNSRPYVNSGSGSGGGPFDSNGSTYPEAGANGIVIIRYPTPANVIIG